MPEDNRLSGFPAVSSLGDGDYFHVIQDDGIGGFNTRRISKPNVKQTLGVQTQGEADARYARRSNNLSDLDNAATARTNLGLGTAATHNVSASGDASTSQVVKGDDTRLSDARTPVSHTHPAEDITGLGAAVPAVLAFGFGDGLNESSLAAGQTVRLPRVPAGSALSFRIDGDSAGDCVIDVQASERETTSWASICGSEKPTLSSDDYAEDTSLSWAAFDSSKKYRAVLESVSGLKEVAVGVEVLRS